MDTLTHALSGMLLARATAGKQSSDNSTGLSLRARLWAGFFAAAFPDSDIIARIFGPLDYIEMHRGITHSIIMLPMWALLLSVVYAKISRDHYHWKNFYLISFLGIGIHIAGDVITSYGTMIFAPFSYIRLSWPTTFIIDFYFTGIILLSILLFSFFRHKAKQIAIAGLVTLFCYVGFEGTLHLDAENVAKDYAVKNNLKNYQVSVMPQPFSPFHWKAIVKTGDTYRVGYINLKSDKVLVAAKDAGLFAKVDALYRPVNKVEWTEIDQYGKSDSERVKQVWNLDIMKPVRQFMLYPSITHEENSDKNCVWFTDLRFILRGVRQSPFEFGACESNNKTWQLFQLTDGTKISLSP